MAIALRKWNDCNSIIFEGSTSFSGSKSLSLESLLSLSGSLLENEKLWEKVELANLSCKISSCFYQTDKNLKVLRDFGLLLSKTFGRITPNNRDVITVCSRIKSNQTTIIRINPSTSKNNEHVTSPCNSNKFPCSQSVTCWLTVGWWSAEEGCLHNYQSHCRGFDKPFECSTYKLWLFLSAP